MNGVIIADISDQAFILHQNHLNIRTKPTPAPHSIINSQAPDILEIKSVNEVIKEHIAQTINYLKISDYRLGIIVNFNQNSLETKRIVL